MLKHSSGLPFPKPLICAEHFAGNTATAGVLAAVISRPIDLSGISCEQSGAMRQLIAILGLLAMLVTLSGPVAALTVKPPCDDAAMAAMAMVDDAEPCKPAAKTCPEPCLAAGNCQSQCGSVVPFVRADADERAWPLFTMQLHAAESEQPPGTDSPVDGPPPRL